MDPSIEPREMKDRELFIMLSSLRFSEPLSAWELHCLHEEGVPPGDSEVGAALRVVGICEYTEESQGGPSTSQV